MRVASVLLSAISILCPLLATASPVAPSFRGAYHFTTCVAELASLGLDGLVSRDICSNQTQAQMLCTVGLTEKSRDPVLSKLICQDVTSMQQALCAVKVARAATSYVMPVKACAQ